MLTLSVPVGSSSDPARARQRRPAARRAGRPPGAGTARRFRSAPADACCAGTGARRGRRSRRATFLLTPAGVRPRTRAAAEKLPCSAVRTNDTRCCTCAIAPILNRGLKLIAARQAGRRAATCAHYGCALRFRSAQPARKNFHARARSRLLASLLALALPAPPRHKASRSAASSSARSRPTAPPSTSAPAARAGGRAAARLRRDRRHVGAAGRGSGARPHGDRPRSARPGPVVEARPAASTRRPRPTTSPACSTR